MVGSRILRAAWRILRRLLEDALLLASGQRRSIACSRWRRWPEARASSFTKAAAFLRRQASWVMARGPTLTRNPPSNRTRTASDRPASSTSTVELIPSLVCSQEQRIPHRCLLISYKIEAYANESTMNQAHDSPSLVRRCALGNLCQASYAQVALSYT